MKWESEEIAQTFLSFFFFTKIVTKQTYIETYIKRLLDIYTK